VVALLQGEIVSEQPAETPTKAARVLLGWFAGGLAFQCIEKYANAPTIWPSIGYGLAAVVVAVGDYKLPWLLSKSPKLTASINRWAADARLWIAIGLCTLLIGIFSPFVEQQRWPFSTWFQTTNGASNVSKTDYDALNEKLEKLNGLVESLQSALGSTRETLEATRIDRDQLKQQLVVAQSKLQDTTSQLEAARQAAHQPPPPPPPEDQIPIRWNADFQMLWGGANGPDAQMMGFRFIG
jgi:hypothetical protein